MKIKEMPVNIFNNCNYSYQLHTLRGPWIKILDFGEYEIIQIL